MTYREMFRSRSFRGAVGLILAVGIAAGAVRLWNSSTWDAGVDFYELWVVGRAAGEPETGDIYNPAEQRRIAGESLAAAHADPEAGRFFIAAEAREEIEIVATPLVYSVFGSLATGDYETDFQRYRALVVLLTLLALPVLGRTVGFGWLQTMAFTALVLLAFEPLYADLRVLGVRQLELALVVLYFGIRIWGDPPVDDLLGGVALAVACLFQPALVPAVVLLGAYWLLDRRWRTALGHAAGAVGGVGLTLLATWLHFGRLGVWIEWAEALRGLPEAGVPVESGNFSFSAVLLERTGLGVANYLTVALMLVAIVVLAVRVRRPTADGTFRAPASPATDRDLRVLAIGILVCLLGAALVRQPEYLLVVPALFLAASPTCGAPRSWWRWALLALVFVPHLADPRVRQAIASGPEAYVLELATGALLLFLLLLTDPDLGSVGRRVEMEEPAEDPFLPQQEERVRSR